MSRARSAALVTVLVAALPIGGCGGSSGKTASGSASSGSPGAPASASRAPAALRYSALGTLPAPLQYPAATALPAGRVALLGGLSSVDVSTDEILVLDGARVVKQGRLPQPNHDGTATSISGTAYMFGGGDQASYDAIMKLDPAAALLKPVRRLPVAASDVSSTTVGDTAYIVGGYTGTRPLDTIVAWKPGSAPRVAGHLPQGLRYAAVAAAGGRVIIAGGTIGTAATRDVLVFDPASGSVRRIGRLPRALTHAAAAPLGGSVYVIGGRGPSTGTPTAAIEAVDPASGRVHAAGRLPRALSDLAAVGLGDHIGVYGGRGASAVVGSVGVLRAAG